MRSRNYFVLVGFAALCLLGLMFVGCSDDSTSHHSAGPDLYQVIQDQSNQSLETTVGYIDDVVGMIDYAQPGHDDTLILAHLGPSPVDSAITPTNGWWVRFSSQLQTDASTSTIDSIRWLNGVTPVSGPLSANGLEFRRHYSVVNADTTVTYANSDIVTNLTFTGTDGTSATVSGSVNFDIQSRYVANDSLAWETYETAIEIPSLTIAKSTGGWTDGCPASGTCELSIDQTFKQNAGAEQSVSWTIDATFTNGAISASVANDASLSATYQAVICNVD